jgi:hypothetical protein
MNADAVDGLENRDADPDAIEARMGSHVEGIMSAARKAAAEFQAEVERSASDRAAQIETAAARRAHAVRMAAEAEAERLVAQTRTATQQYVTASRRLVDEFARERMNRIAEIGDKLAAHAEALIDPLTRSEELARQLYELRTALGAASERIASEAASDSPHLPELASLPRPSESMLAPGDAESDEEGHAEGSAPSPSLEERLARATGRGRRRAAPPGDELSARSDPEDPPDEA